MKFLVSEPVQVISHSFMFGIERMIHIFGTTDMDGILTVPDDDKFINVLKARYLTTENDIPLTSETIGEELKLNTAPITGITDKLKGDKPNERKCTASSNASTKSKRTFTTGSNSHGNSKNSGGCGAKGSKSR